MDRRRRHHTLHLTDGGCGAGGSSNCGCGGAKVQRLVLRCVVFGMGGRSFRAGFWVLQSSGPLWLDDAVLASPVPFFGGVLRPRAARLPPSHFPMRVSRRMLSNPGWFGAGSCVCGGFVRAFRFVCCVSVCSCVYARVLDESSHLYR